MTPKVTPANDNGRITDAVLGNKIDNLTEKLDDFISEVRPLIAVIAVQGQMLIEFEKNMDDLKSNDKRWNIGLIIGMITAGILGALGISR